jgi:hypothetical protein
MWSVEITSKSIKDGDLFVTLVYSEGKEVVTETLRTHLAQSSTWLAEQAARRVEQLTALYSYADSLATGPLDYTIKEPPKADEEAKAAFSDKYRVLKKLEALSATGVDVQSEIERIKSDIAADYAANPAVIEVL